MREFTVTLAVAAHFCTVEALLMTTPGEMAALIEAHHATLWRYLRYLGCDRALADDLTQETFLAVMQDPFEDRGRASTSAYLRTVARNLFLMNVRRSKFVQNRQDLQAADAAWDRANADDSEDRQVALRHCLQLVQGKARQALDLTYSARLSGQAVAAQLGMSHDNLRVMLHRTRLSLRQCIEKKLGSRP